MKWKDMNKIPTFEEFDNLIFGNSKICDYKSYIFTKPVFHLNGIYGDRNHLGDMNNILSYLRHKKKNLMQI